MVVFTVTLITLAFNPTSFLVLGLLAMAWIYLFVVRAVTHCHWREDLQVPTSCHICPSAWKLCTKCFRCRLESGVSCGPVSEEGLCHCLALCPDMPIGDHC